MNDWHFGPPPEPTPHAASLVDRLVALDAELLDVELRNTTLQRQLHEVLPAGLAGPGSAAAFDFPRTQHGWPLADDPQRDPADLDLYERRVDDDVFAVARAGTAFMERFGLLGETPDFVAAAHALAGMPPVLALCGTDDPAPDVSIVIPVYGQLAYTLACLESLLGHGTERRVEIIVIDDVSPDETALILKLVPDIRIHRPAQNGGFIASCNAGGAMARGKYLVMLNNDTRVLPGWLDALIDSFSIFPQAGLVGSKLLYPDGTLQEAGGIIWRDGTGWNYGRNDDPNRPQYCHARQVDYVSGASIALPADLWARLGGFDTLYAPAYNEDSDLAFRVRAAGHEVWFQSQSRLIHYEGKTSGTDLAAGTKAYQVVNARKFYIRWRETLLAHRPGGEAPFFEHERAVRQRVLVVDATCPTPKHDAGSVTTTLNLKVFQSLGFKTCFAPQDNMLYQPVFTTDLQRFGVECAYAPYDKQFSEYIRYYGHLFDAVLVFRITVLEKVIDLVRLHAPQAPLLFNNMDLHFLRMQREAELSGNEAALAAAATMKTKEIALIQQVDCTMTPSTFEQTVLANEAPGAPVVVLPFMIDFYGTERGFDDRRDICFLGGYGHTPNADAVVFFVNEVFPLIRRAAPGMRFIIAGARPTAEVLALACEDVVVTGMIDDLRDVFDTTRVFVCPLRVGAGVKGKVAAAMSYGLPVVTTAIGAEGMDLIDGEHVLFADTPDELSAACLRLYRDETLWASLSNAGLALVKQHYSLEAGKTILAEAIETAFRHKLGL